MSATEPLPVAEAKAGEALPATEAARADEGFLSRWHRLKTAPGNNAVVNPAEQAAEPPTPGETSPPQPSQPPLSDADMPPLTSLTANSDIKPFLSEGVSDSLRRRALRRIFMGGKFNARDGLDDYDEDFTNFTALGDIVTAEARRLKERFQQSDSTEESDAVETQSNASQSAPPKDEECSECAEPVTPAKADTVTENQSKA